MTEPGSPIVIVGAGPVGMSAALLLSRWAVPSVVLESKEHRDPVGSKALCMQRDVLDILERVGCGEILVREGVTWTLGRTYYREHELFQITFDDEGDSVFPPFVNIGQDRTELHLERAVRDAGIEIRYGTTVHGIRETSDGVAVEARGHAGPVQIEAPYVIGADGAGSVTRRLLDVSFDGRSFDDQFLICDIRADLPFADERRFFFDPPWNPDRQVLIHPQTGSVWRIDWQVPPDFDIEHETRSGALDSRVRQITEGADYEIVWMSVYRFHQRVASSFRVGRAFLAGDAAHLMAPFGARGLNSGIQDAENLAWKLAYVSNGLAGGALLDSYEPERRSAALENLRVTGKTMDFLVPRTERRWQERRAALEAAVFSSDPRSLVDSGSLASPFVYSDSPLTTPDREMRTVPAGALCPDAPLRGPHGRLRAAIGPMFTVLTSGLDELVAPSDSIPVLHIRLEDGDTTGVLRRALELGDQEGVLLRPDGHVAARFGSSEELGAALAKAVAN